MSKAGTSHPAKPDRVAAVGPGDILESLGVFDEIARGLKGVSDITEICTRVVDVLKARLGLKTCSIMLLAEDGETLVNVAGTAPRSQRKTPPLAHRRFHLGEGIAGLVAQTGEPIRVVDVMREPRFSTGNGASSVRALLCLPIGSEDGPMGVLNLSHATPGFFNDTHQTVFGILATILGKILSEVRLSQELAHFNRDLERQVEERTHEIAASHAYREQILHQANDIILTVDWRGRITYVNRQIEALGYTPERVLGKRFTLLCADRAMPAPLMDAMAGRFSQNVELALVGDNGVRLDTYCGFSPMDDPEGTGQGALIMIRDITKNRQLELQLRQMEKLTAVGTLVAGIAHEINNKLVPILVYSELLQRAALSEKDQKLLGTIHKSAVGARHIMESLLRFSRQENPRKEVLQLNEVLQDVVAMVQYRTKKQHIEIVQQFDPNLPALLMDGHQIGQVALNLLNNACDAIDQGEGRIVVSTSAGPSGVCMVVEDTGPGIDHATLARIFDPFFTTKEVGKGTGLGLSLCFGIVKEHGGDIQVESRPGCTRFTVTLPVAKDDTERSAGSASPVVAEPRRRGRLLIADADPVLLDVLEHVLGGHHTVVRVESGSEVISRLSEGGFDLVLIDPHIAGRDGVDVLGWLRDHRPELLKHLLFLTDGASIPEAIPGDGGSGRFISKPFRVAEVLERVDHMLERSS